VNCYQHPSSPALAFCRTCGRGLCAECQRSAEGTVFCQEHLPVVASYSSAASTPPDPGPNPYYQVPYQAAPATGAAVQTSPGLAFILGIIPGVGAIYNGQYFKGFIHVAILGLLISIANSAHMSGAIEPFVALLIGVWAIYMPFEAYHTAKKRQMGIAIDEWSSLLPRGSVRGSSSVPAGPVILIVIGVLFLLDNLGLLPLVDVLRYWPLLLIGLGVYLLYARLNGPLPVVPPPSGPFPPPPPPTGDQMGVPYER
jgi:TM2 domain-containing membrane protein YozV